jgi:8-oxo-dGTP diphosphatase
MLVTCAIILFDSKILAVQRSEKMKMPLKWEFPGGKLEAGESEEVCIKRELKEELGIDVEILKRLQSNVHRYPEFEIELLPFVVKWVSGDLKLTEHKSYQLLLPQELESLDWAEADVPILHDFVVNFKSI